MKQLTKNQIALVIWGIVIISTLFLAFTVRFVITSFRIFSVTGQSMEPTYKDGAVILSFKISPNYSPKIGQIIIYQSKTNRNLSLIQRVIGLPGDIIEIREGKVIRNNQEIQEPYLAADTKTLAQVDNSSGTTKLQISKNHLYLLGDNRSNSLDSRIQGEIPTENVEALVLFCITKCD